MFQQIMQAFATKGLGSFTPSVLLGICGIDRNLQSVAYNGQYPQKEKKIIQGSHFQ